MLQQLVDIDRQLTLFINGSSSIFVDEFALEATSTLTWIPMAIAFLYLVMHANRGRDVFSIVMAVALCVLLADQIASGIFKPLFARYRPSQDPELMHLVDIVNGYRGGRYGFFSSHAANTFALATFSSFLVRHKGFTCSIFSWALLNCWTRVYLGVHYVGDILAGMVCGTIVGGCVYALLLRCLLRRHSYSNTNIQTSTGYSYQDISIVIAVLLLSYLYCIIAAFIQ